MPVSDVDRWPCLLGDAILDVTPGPFLSAGLMGATDSEEVIAALQGAWKSVPGVVGVALYQRRVYVALSIPVGSVDLGERQKSVREKVQASLETLWASRRKSTSGGV